MTEHLTARETIEAAYYVLLGRMPESEAVVDFYRNISSRELLSSLVFSEEFALRNGKNPLFNYNSQLSCESIIHAHAVPGVLPSPDLCVNFIGARLSPKFMPEILNGMVGIVDRIPIPGNWHADIAEWGAVLRAIDLSKRRFNMLELGCGWGCWMVNSGVAARNAGRVIHVSGVEADEGHIAFADEACRLNGFGEHEFTLKRGVVSARAGGALFPRQDRPGECWGNEPIFDVSPSRRMELESQGSYDYLPNVKLSDLSNNEPFDLIHLDIQGGEADFASASIEELNECCRYVVIGTHSREIEGRLFETFLSNGWTLEIERPAIIRLSAAKPLTMIDGVQGWRNPRF